MPTPKNKDDVKRFLGFVTYLAKLIPNLSELDAPLSELLKKDAVFDWQPAQEAFVELKEQCCSQLVLKYFDLKEPVEIQCDARQHGLGAVLIQDSQPIAYSSRSLTDIEGHYAQIEIKMLSIVHAFFFGFYLFIFFYRYTTRTYRSIPTKINLQTTKKRKKQQQQKTTLLYTRLDYTTLHCTTLHNTTLRYTTRIKTHIQLELKLKSNLGNLRKTKFG